MVGITTRRKPDGITLYIRASESESSRVILWSDGRGGYAEVVLDRVTCEHILESIVEAKEESWEPRILFHGEFLTVGQYLAWMREMEA